MKRLSGFVLLLLAAQPALAARGESLAAFDERCIPAGCVAPRSNTPGMLGRRALPAGRLARLGATPDFHHGLLAQQYSVRGMVLSVDRARNTFTVSHEEIPGFMPAMTMPFEVRQSKDLDGLVAGAAVEFALLVDGKTAYAERLRIVRYQGMEADPLTASRLKQLHRIVGPPAADQAVAIGDIVPDFTLTDQKGRQVALADLRGKVVAINFMYTRCALTIFCLRVTSHFGVLQKRFKQQLGRDLMLLTVTFDPIHDTPDVLAQVADGLKADSENWRFLTGAVADVKRVSRLFDVDAFPDEGLMNHSLHTALIDRQGKLLANIEGNQFTAVQLGDLTEAALRR